MIISDDIDLFITDSQWIGHLTPRLNDDVDPLVDSYDETAGSLKLRSKYGEIDFIVSRSLLGLSEEHVQDVPFALDPVAEVLAKKLFYRGWGLTPRDLYDWWAIETCAPQSIPQAELARLIEPKIAEIGAALSVLHSSPSAAQVWESVRAVNRLPFQAAVEWAQHRLSALAAHRRSVATITADMICEAIRKRILIEFEYDGLHRIVAPYCHGFSTRGRESLRGVQVGGDSHSQDMPSGKLWTLSKMGDVRLTVQSFTPDDPNYNPNDSGMSQIHCRV